MTACSRFRLSQLWSRKGRFLRLSRSLLSAKEASCYLICWNHWKLDRRHFYTTSSIYAKLIWFTHDKKPALEDCDFIYDKVIKAFVFTKTKDCQFISTYLDFYKDLTVVVIIAIVDIITVAKVHLSSIQLRNAGQQIDSRRKKEINFLKQAVLQGMIFVVELYTYFHLAWQVENVWAVWVATTVAWTLVHSTDGLIIIVFNAEFRKLVSSPKQIFKVTAHETHSNLAVERITEKNQA
ncbi:unnamed protein product [Cylicocyclus nassatus]|uniref:7TM GPCR serpentine receptor class x (Srx) domain-containing protein n=1 Tax=Cylicocyclus nassatus TaxID=53992 RepID=A0AA36DL94_CYLNA|nr:unnamed protein product [Cylicocyclus nassatus]